MGELGDAGTKEVKSPYTPEFYVWQKEGSVRSAREILPRVFSLIQPRSVVDIGSGVGSWLSVFQEQGVTDILGVDGDYVDKAQLLIPQDKFKAHDLEKPLHLDRKFDLGVSLEVAEHIPQEHAGAFIDSLTRHSPVVLFSAAIPAQGGVQHVNERWPSYWAEHFKERGYSPIDVIRREVWDNPNVDWWYAQNILLFAHADAIAENPALQDALSKTYPSQLNMVHPRNYEEAYKACPKDLYWQKRYGA